MATVHGSQVLGASSSEGLSPQGVYISTYGCQMNVNDSERMATILEMHNYTPQPSPEGADLIIINSCSVREKPVHKVRSEVGRYKWLKKKNPQLKIGVGGCVGQQEKKNLLKDLPLLDFVFGPDNIDELPEILQQLSKSSRLAHARLYPQKAYQTETLIRNPGISTFVNITKGCDNFCTFCVVPFTRGRLRCRDEKEIIKDIQNLTERGVKEVTLLGQNVNSYQSGVSFAGLLDLICRETDVMRVRYTTSHPKDFDYDLVEIMAKWRPRICDYVHLPVQSGSSEVLERMNRGYTRTQYIQKAQMIQEALPGVALSTDIIVGFPGETQIQYEETLSLLDEVPYESLFAFQYSPRPFTKATRWKDHIPKEEKAIRLQRLLKKHEELSFALAKRYKGQIKEVLVESVNAAGGRGRSSENKVVHFAGGEASLVGQVVQVQVERAHPHTLHGQLCERASSLGVEKIENEALH